MKRKKWNIYIAFGFIAACALFIIFYPKKVEYDLEVAGKVLPSEEMQITRSMDGIVSAVTVDYISGMEKSAFMTELERGDLFRIQYNPAIHTGAAITAGDTICWIQSQQTERDLIELQNELVVEEAALALARAGDKESVINEALHDRDTAREQLREHRKIVERQKQLHESQLISDQEYELAQSQLRLYEIEVDKAQSRLETVQTGTIPQEIDYIIAKIASIEREIRVLSDKISQLHITAPFPGTVLDPGIEGNVLNIGNTSQLCVIMPIKLKNIEYVHRNQKVEYLVEGLAEPLHGEILNVGNVTNITRDVQTILAVATIDAADITIPIATIVRCQIVLEPVTLLEYIFRSVNTVFNR